MRALFAALLLVSIGGAARADDVGVVVSGEATLQPQLAAGVESWLRDHGHTVVPSPLVPEATNKLIDCFVIEDLGCARQVIEGQSKAPTVVFARVDVSPRQDGTRDFTIVGYWIVNGHDPVAERRTCSRCTEQGMRETLGTLLVALVVAPPPPDRLVVAIPHAAASAAPSVVEARPQPVLAAGIAGAGAAALITGVILIAVDQDPPGATGEQPPTYRDTATGGFVLALAGAAAVGAGAYLWWRGSHAGAPIAAVTGRSGLVGWSGRF
jgi:hypothetical protein